MTWIILLAVFGALWWIDIGDVQARPWWPLIQVTVMFLGAFVVVMVVEALRACWGSRLREPTR